MTLWRVGASLLLLTLLTAGCENLAQQPRSKTWQPADDQHSRKTWPPLPAEHAIAREDVAKPVPPLTASLLERGHERFTVYCAPCHGFQGQGDGMIVKRGFPAPPRSTSTGCAQRRHGTSMMSSPMDGA